MTISDETLAAYVDGELDAASRAEVEAALAADSGLVARVERERRLKARLKQAFEPVVHEATPVRLLSAVEGGRRARPAQIVSLAEARAARAPKEQPARRWVGGAVRWGSLAASLLAGVFVGRYFLADGSAVPIGVNGRDGLVAQGALGRSLSDQLSSSTADPAAPLRVGMTFRSTDNRFCRTFQTRASRPRAGIACREDGAWRIRMVTDIPAAGAGGGYYHTAGSDTPPMVLQAMEGMMAGEALDAAGEREAQRNGWR